jgi:hypothetical protein
MNPPGTDDHGLFLDRGVLWRPRVGASVGVIEEVPPPWFDALLLRWWPTWALRRAQAWQALRQLEQQVAEAPGMVRMQSWSHADQRWEQPRWIPTSFWAGGRRR